MCGRRFRSQGRCIGFIRDAGFCGAGVSFLRLGTGKAFFVGLGNGSIAKLVKKLGLGTELLGRKVEFEVFYFREKCAFLVEIGGFLRDFGCLNGLQG